MGKIGGSFNCGEGEKCNMGEKEDEIILEIFKNGGRNKLFLFYKLI